MTDREPGPENFECVEPELGASLWRLDTPELDPQLRESLQLHVTICDACRLRLATAREVGRGLDNGALRLDAPLAGSASQPGSPPRGMSRGPGRPTRVGWAGGLALAAGVALSMVVRPLPNDARLLERAERGAPHFLLPVEGEVIVARAPLLRWAPIAGATSYRVTVRQIGGSYLLEQDANAPRLQIPQAAKLPARGSLVASLHPVPADLAPPQGFTVSFRTGSLSAFVRYRLSASPGWTRWLAGAGLVVLLASVARRPRRRRVDAQRPSGE